MQGVKLLHTKFNSMTTTQLFNQITSLPKWWEQAGVRYNTGAMMKKRFSDGDLSHKRITELFGKFGYKELPGDWVKEEETK